jgi:hypothetical protein
LTQTRFWRVSFWLAKYYTMSQNGISHLATKQARQAAKLAAAAAKRAATGRRHVLDTTELPTVYTGNAVTKQSHPSGLIKGRPWK